MMSLLSVFLGRGQILLIVEQICGPASCTKTEIHYILNTAVERTLFLEAKMMHITTNFSYCINNAAQKGQRLTHIQFRPGAGTCLDICNLFKSCKFPYFINIRTADALLSKKQTIAFANLLSCKLKSHLHKLFNHLL